MTELYFNVNNKGHKDGNYPLFLGEKLGLYDSVNVAYPEIEELYQQQFAQRWSEFEFDLTQDRMDMQTLPKEVVDLMAQTIMWQHLGDSCACKSVTEVLLPWASNSELEGMLTIQGFFEIIHSRTYSHIIKQTLQNPAQLFEDIYNNPKVIERSMALVNAFQTLHELQFKPSTKEEKQAAILKVMFALMSFEGVSFMSSFAVTFAIAETDVFQGIAGLVGLICADELLHTKMDYTVIKALLRDPEWMAVFQEIKPEIKEIMDAVVRQEDTWTDYLFTEGRKVIGLSPTLLKEFVRYMATPLYKSFGIEAPFTFIDKNPLPYMEKYLKSGVIQAAAQEVQLSDYNVGAIVDDTDGLDLEFDL